jgi:hypothetical protein
VSLGSFVNTGQAIPVRLSLGINYLRLVRDAVFLFKKKLMFPFLSLYEIIKARYNVTKRRVAMTQVGEHLSVTNSNEHDKSPGQTTRQLGKETLRALESQSDADAIVLRGGGVPIELRYSRDNPMIQLGDQ